MQKLTVAGRLIVTALIIGAIYFGFRMFGGQEALKKLAPIIRAVIINLPATVNFCMIDIF